MRRPLGRGSRLALRRSFVAVTLSAAVIQCDVDLGSRPATPDQTLGEQVFRESCQRVAYTAQLSEQAAGKRSFVDASGVSYRPLCSDGQAPPADAPSILAAVSAERSHIILGVDTAVPTALYDDLDQALRGTMPALEGLPAQQAAEAGGTTLLQVADSSNAVAAMARLGWRDGFTPPHTAGGLARGLLAAPMLHESLLAVLPVLSDSQPGAGDARGAPALKALLTVASREVGAVTAVARPQAPDRTLNLLNRFLFSESSRACDAANRVSRIRRCDAITEVCRSSALQGTALPAPYVDKDKDGYADSDAKWSICRCQRGADSVCDTVCEHQPVSPRPGGGARQCRPRPFGRCGAAALQLSEPR
jgi:hypothetical protein